MRVRVIFLAEGARGKSLEYLTCTRFLAFQRDFCLFLISHRDIQRFLTRDLPLILCYINSKNYINKNSCKKSMRKIASRPNLNSIILSVNR